MMKRRRISSGTPFEAKVGYSRVVVVGNHVFVAGTTAMNNGQLVGIGDARLQTRQTLANILWALEQAGATANDVVRYRLYLTNIADWPVVTEEVADVFGGVRPVATLVEVKGLIDPDMLIEIEVDAILGMLDE
jgi:enamine deaminase RidA (YjgF/YER057c/UK114 family)